MTKRYGNLFEKVVTLENLYLADEKARRGKTSRPEVIRHDANRDAEIIALHDKLLAGDYRTSEYSTFTVLEPKEREISRLPYYPDRITHHAIMNVCEPIWTKTFTHNTFSCIKGRGIHGCKRYVRKIIRSFKGRRLFCLKIDIKKFYPSVKPEVLMRLVRKKIKDTLLLRVLDEIICSSDGLPIGNYLSQYFANLILCYFMHWVNEVLRVKAAEYADDIVFFADNKAELRDVLQKVQEKLGEIGLRLKENYQIFPIANCAGDRTGRALDYVGYCFYRFHTALRKSIKKNYCRRVAVLNKLTMTIKEYKQALSAWLGWTKHADCKNLMKTTIRIDYYESIFKRQAKCA